MRPKILMIAYACNPEMHGEHWLGWGWALQAAALGEVHLLAPTWAQAALERHAPAAGIRTYFPEVSRTLLRITEPMGNRGLWIRQYAWQHHVARLAAELHACERFDVVQQTTFHTFRVPFRAAWLGIPAIWGPMAGGESTPPGFGPWLGRARWAETARPILNRLCLWQPAVQRSLRAARKLFVSNQTTLDFLPVWCREKACVVPPNAVRDDQVASAARAPRGRGGALSLLYLGNCIATRSIPLVLAAMQEASDVPTRLTIAGDGPALAAWRAEVEQRGLQVSVRFPGRVTLEQLPALYAETDALVFPGLRDSGGSSLLEAMSLQVPVVCFDWGGPGEIVRPENGVKVSVASSATAVSGMAEALRRLWREPAWAHELGVRAAADVRERFTWDRKREILRETYVELGLRPD